MCDFSIEVDKYNSTALGYCLKKLENIIPEFEYDWRMYINAGSIDYGIYINISIDRKEIEICNQPRGKGEDSLDDVEDYFMELEEEEGEE